MLINSWLSLCCMKLPWDGDDLDMYHLTHMEKLLSVTGTYVELEIAIVQNAFGFKRLNLCHSNYL